MTSVGPNGILFTQYLRPNGRRKDVWVERSPEVAATAAKIKAAGYHFDIEELMTGHVSMTVEPNTPDKDGEDAPIAHVLCSNGPPVLEAVDKLVADAAAHLFAKGETDGEGNQGHDQQGAGHGGDAGLHGQGLPGRDSGPGAGDGDQDR